MNYMITKKHPDSRTHTCGVWIPDGFTVVMELTESRIVQFQRIKRFGYKVEQTDMEPCAFDNMGRAIEYDSIQEHFVFERPFRFIEDKPTQVSEEEAPEKVDNDLERDILMMREQLDARGIKYRKDAKLETLKKKLASA